MNKLQRAALTGILVWTALETQVKAADKQTITTESMTRIVFTGDSQTCGRNLAIDYPQILSWELPARVVNTGVGGSNSSALLRPMKSGKVRITKGDTTLHGEHVRWGMGPFPDMTVTVHGQTYTIDHVHEHPHTPNTEIILTEPAREDYEGTDCAVEPGWDVRVASHRPDIVTLMYINDGNMPPPKRQDWREMIRRIRAMGAVPVLMSPVPVDSNTEGGNHPGDNNRYTQSAEVVRGLAVSEKCWYVDVFHLFFALDPALRGLITDGIHPDTDGQTVLIDGLRWVFREMGLYKARPYLRGWITDKGGVKRPFLTAQPDHPTPDRQLTEGFTIEAFRRNDEYGLIARKDRSELPVTGAVTIEFGLPKGTDPTSLVLRWAGSGLTLADTPTELTIQDGEQRCVIPEERIVDQRVRVRLEATGDGATLDWIGLDVATDDTLARWQAPDGVFREYKVESDHARPDNLIQNPAFTEDSSHWTGGLVNRPFRRELGPIRFHHEKDPRIAEIPNPGPVRTFDIVVVSGSEKGSDGRYGVRNRIDADHFRMRRRSKGDEAELTAELVHNDGNPLVPGGCCLELPREDTVARQRIELPPNTEKLQFSFLLRVMDAARLGTRDTPNPLPDSAALVFAGQDGKTILRTPLPIPQPSYQWRRYELVTNVPKDCTSVTCEFRGVADGAAALVTGIFLAPTK